MAEFENGTLVHCRATFQDPDTLVYVDPDTVTATVTDPLGTVTTYVFGTDVELQQESTGHYKLEVTANTLGTWIYRYTSSGIYQGAKDGTFYIY
jgi:hypothetical protein